MNGQIRFENKNKLNIFIKHFLKYRFTITNYKIKIIKLKHWFPTASSSFY